MQKRKWDIEELLFGVGVVKKHLLKNSFIDNIAFDSRAVNKNSLFVAVKGRQTDGHKYIEQVIDKGVKAIVVEDWQIDVASEIVQIQVKNSAKALAILACNFYDHPSKKLKLTGVTGTNGKSTIVSLLKQLFDGLGYKTGLLSTINNIVVDKIYESTHTTPNPVMLNELLDKMVEAGCEYAFMEVSSHAIDQERTAGLDFDTAIFTNISHDHLDYHGDMKTYIATKKRLFDNLKKSAYAIVNQDDKRGAVMVQNTKAIVKTFALQSIADYKGKIIEQDIVGTLININGQEMHSRIVGRFNAENMMAVYACGDINHVAPDELLMQMSNLKAVEGRFEYVIDKSRSITGLVDYAHTPDALKKVLETIVDIKNKSAKIITVVGCGGDRDKAKRPKMASIAADLSDQLILTSDNPRSEDPLQILQDMEQGLDADQKHEVLTIEDRRTAIKMACKLAKTGDIILVTGKGHEKYQEIKGVKTPFDDKKILKEELKI
jgi:UDP-N-acetylmuramoyl-L-alanyl-D-glutamate--2,6-diaminopimelate ligase